VLVRALLIGAVGLASRRRSGVAVILAYYALLFVLAIPLLRLRRGSLVAVAVGVALHGSVRQLLLRGDQGLRSAGANPTFDIAVESPLGLIWGLGLLGYYPAFIWLAYVLHRLAAVGSRSSRRRTAAACSSARSARDGRARRVRSAARSARRASEIAARASAEQLRALDQGHSMFGNTPTDTWWWLAVDAPHSSTPNDWCTRRAPRSPCSALCSCRAVRRSAAPAAGRRRQHDPHPVHPAVWLLSPAGCRTTARRRTPCRSRRAGARHAVAAWFAAARWRPLWRGRAAPPDERSASAPGPASRVAEP
jgi:hypothetical protein